jgi:hypothetical protein
MQSQQQSTQQELAQWLKAFESQKTALEQQIEQFSALQQAVQGLAAQGSSSANAVKKLEQLKALEQNADYTQMRERALSQIALLEQQFSELADWGDDPTSGRSAKQRQREAATATTSPFQQPKVKKRAKGFV